MAIVSAIRSTEQLLWLGACLVFALALSACAVIHIESDKGAPSRPASSTKGDGSESSTFAVVALNDAWPLKPLEIIQVGIWVFGAFGLVRRVLKRVQRGKGVVWQSNSVDWVSLLASFALISYGVVQIVAVVNVGLSGELIPGLLWTGFALVMVAIGIWLLLSFKVVALNSRTPNAAAKASEPAVAPALPASKFKSGPSH